MDVREKLVELLYDAMFLDGYGRELCEQQADYFIANGVTVQEWISVKDRLPEVDTPVLTYRETGQNVELLWQRGCQKRWDYDEFTPYPVTHWMPLPQPPKGE